MRERYERPTQFSTYFYTAKKVAFFHSLYALRKEKIITLSMPLHSAHLLQPLDVALFAPLKRAYGDHISASALHHMGHIDRLALLTAVNMAFEKSSTKENICSGL